MMSGDDCNDDQMWVDNDDDLCGDNENDQMCSDDDDDDDEVDYNHLSPGSCSLRRWDVSNLGVTGSFRDQILQENCLLWTILFFMSGGLLAANKIRDRQLGTHNVHYSAPLNPRNYQMASFAPWES